MQRLAQVPKLISVSVVMAILFSGCAHGPVAECRSLISAVNQGNNRLTNVDLNDEKAVEQKGNELEQISQKLETLEITDKKLQKWRNDFAKIYQTYSDAFDRTSEAISLVNNPSPTDVTVEQVQQAKLNVDRSSLSIQQASQQAKDLSNQLNDYCPVLGE